MDTSVGRKPAADLRDYLAEERTFLAWIRTGLALMGFGFVVARFGLFLAEIQVTRYGSAAPPNRWPARRSSVNRGVAASASADRRAAVA